MDGWKSTYLSQEYISMFLSACNFVNNGAVMYLELHDQAAEAELMFSVYTTPIVWSVCKFKSNI